MRWERMVAVAVAGLAMSPAGCGTSGAAGAQVIAAARSVALTRCSADRGTLVAVDFAHWGGPIVRGCAVGARTADGALQAIGVTTAGDDHDGPGFICRLGDPAFRHGAQFPTAAEQDCVNTPAASGYWSSWLASAGAPRFHYSQFGVADEAARPGETLLWTFGATNIAGTSGSAVPRFTAGALRATPGKRSGAELGARIVDAVSAAPRASSGSATGFVIGGCVVIALGTAAGLTARSRRRAP